MNLDLPFIVTTLPAFGKAVWVTLQLGTIVILTSLAVALLNVALLSLHKRPLSALIRGYVELARNTPLLIQLFFLYFRAACARLVALRVYYRGDCHDLPRRWLSDRGAAGGHSGGARQSAGGWQGHRAFSLATAAPRAVAQAWLASLPALFANFIFLLKETTVASAVAVPELLYTTKNYIALYYKTYEMLAVLTLMCVLIFLPLSLALRVVERRLQHGQFGH